MTAVSAALRPHRTATAVVAAVVFYLSTQMFFQPHLLAFWTPAELALEWLAYLRELALTALAMGAAYALALTACRRAGAAPWLRAAVVCLALQAAAAAALWTAALHRSTGAADLGAAFSGGLRFAVIGVYLVAMQSLWRRVRDTDAAAIVAAAGREALAREHQALRLQLLNAQIEPHFLFNTLANLRRLYRTDPARGASIMASLQRYLRAALPRVRRDDATLADELDLVRGYLELIAVRVGPRLSFSVGDTSGAALQPFPPMVLLTLVENAVKHGIEPAPEGGRIDVCADRSDGALRITVADDGVGLGGAASSGTGVGLANVRAQLHSRYGARARLTISGGARGVVSTVVIEDARPR